MPPTWKRLVLLFLFAAVWAPSVCAQEAYEPSWTIDESPTPRVIQKNLLDVPDSLRRLFPFVDGLLRQVNTGQQSGDPLALLDALRDLRRLQGTSSTSQPSLNSIAVLREATDMAWEQRDPEALDAALGQWAIANRNTQSYPADLESTKERLEQVREERDDMLDRKRCRIVFQNRTGRPITIMINRKPQGTLSAGKTQVVTDMLAGRLHLGAYTESVEWGPRQVYVGPGEVFNWRLFD